MDLFLGHIIPPVMNESSMVSIHAVLTIEDSFMTGGMIQPESSIAQVMTNMGYILQTHHSTNEDAPRQPPRSWMSSKTSSTANARPGAFSRHEPVQILAPILAITVHPDVHAKTPGYIIHVATTIPMLPRSVMAPNCTAQNCCTVWCHNGVGLHSEGTCNMKVETPLEG
jgi:hypothetical protein